MAAVLCDSLDTFLVSYSPSLQAEIGNNVMMCVKMATPTLQELNRHYGDTAAMQWLIPQLNNLSDFCSCKEKLSEQLLLATAQQIAVNYQDIKVTELLLFFWQLKAAKYGPFYGSIDPVLIMERLSVFKSRLIGWREKAEQEMKNLEKEEHRKKCITREEYDRLTNNRRQTMQKKTENVNKSIKLTPQQIGKALLFANDILHNPEGEQEIVIREMEKAFVSKYSCYPKEFVSKYQEKGNT